MNQTPDSPEQTDPLETQKTIADDVGKLVLRASVAGLMLFHGVAKLTGGVGGIEGMLTEAGLPTILAYGVYAGEVIAPLLMMAGFLTRLSSIVFAFNMLVAIFLGHGDELLILNQYGGWAIELPVLYLSGAVSVALLGPGRFAFWRGRGIWQ